MGELRYFRIYEIIKYYKVKAALVIEKKILIAKKKVRKVLSIILCELSYLNNIYKYTIY